MLEVINSWSAVLAQMVVLATNPSMGRSRVVVLLVDSNLSPLWLSLSACMIAELTNVHIAGASLLPCPGP